MDANVVIETRYRGPPRGGNGGYVAGLLAGGAASARVVLRAPIPVDVPLRLRRAGDAARLESLGGDLIAQSDPAAEDAFADPPPRPPSFADAERAGRRFPGLERTFHPVCFTCGVDLPEGEGLRAFVGALEGREDGLVAGVWTSPAQFADMDGLIRGEVVWAALDCPGSVAWLVSGGHGGLLGTVTGRVLRRPALGEATIIIAWPVEQSGRKRLSGTALYDLHGALLAETRQVWITFP